MHTRVVSNTTSHILGNLTTNSCPAGVGVTKAPPWSLASCFAIHIRCSTSSRALRSAMYSASESFAKPSLMVVSTAVQRRVFLLPPPPPPGKWPGLG